MQLKNKPLFPHPSLLFFLLLIPLFLSACAQKPWDATLGETEYEKGLQLAEEIAAEHAQCSKGFQADLLLEYTNPLQQRRFSGFLQYSPNTQYKFVASNPLGQPIFIVAGNQKYYQVINTLESKYVAGGMTSFALRYRLPIHFLKGRWDDWLTGRNTIPLEDITDISSDRELRGIWLTFEDSRGAKNISHLLIDPEQKVILERVLETRQKKPLATIRYGDFFQEQSCIQPQHINISGLEYGTEIDLRLSTTELTSERKTYKLTPPQGYLKQFRP